MESEETISLTEAASLLGISEDAVKKRIRAGTLRGKKVGRRWMVLQESIRKVSGNSPDAMTLLLDKLSGEVAYLRSHLTEQLAAKDQQLREQLSVKDQQIQKLYEDIESWREQVRYKELQIARLQDRMIPLPSPEEPEPTRQASEVREPAAAQTAGSENVLSRFWRWFVGGD